MAQIDITPRRCLLDEKWRVRVTKLRPSQPVTLVSRVEEDNIRYFANAHYISSATGEVNVNTMPAQLGGSYDGIEPMGLVWSQTQEPGQKPGRRLVKADVTVPIETHVYVLDGCLDAEESLRQIVQGSWLSYTSCDRLHVGEGVQRIPVRDGRLVATLFLPKGPGPFLGVVDMFGATVGVMEHRAALLASRGIACLGLCFSSPTVHHGILSDMEYFEEAVDFLLRHPKIQKPYVGAVGVSKGAEFVLLMGSLFTDKIRACVSINGSIIPTLQTHTYKGEEFPFVSRDVMIGPSRAEDGAIQFIQDFDQIGNSKNAFKFSGIPVERAKAEFLLIHGEDDHTVPPAMAAEISGRLSANGRDNCRVLMYPGAGHLIEPPYSPHFSKTYHALFKSLLDWGGECKLHARAQDDSWQQIISFMKETLGKANKHPTVNASL